MNVTHRFGDPKDLILPERNARYFPAEKFQRLVDNIRADKVLSQWPFVWRDPDNDDLHVLSGSHRVRAAIAAGLEQIDWTECDEPLSPGRRRAIQVSHNELVGNDDPAILDELLAEIAEPDDRDYSGFDDDVWEDEEVEPYTLPEPDETTTIMLTFLPDDLAKATEVLNELDDLQGNMPRWLAASDQYDAVFDALTVARKSYDTRNVTTTLTILLDLVRLHAAALRSGWYDAETELARRDDWVPLASLGFADLPADAAAVLARAADKAVHTGDVNHPWQLLELLAAEYLAQN